MKDDRGTERYHFHVYQLYACPKRSGWAFAAAIRRTAVISEYPMTSSGRYYHGFCGKILNASGGKLHTDTALYCSVF